MSQKHAVEPEKKQKRNPEKLASGMYSSSNDKINVIYYLGGSTFI
jgi:hypothetical protein